MSLVSTISTETIYPETHTDSTQAIHLTPWELNLLAVNPIQKGLLFNSKPTESTWLADLKTSLSTTLDRFYILAGRLSGESNRFDNTESVFIQCNNEGAEFIHATADITVSDILTPLHVPGIVYDLFSLNGYINYNEDGSQPPLLTVQVTELIDGIFIGFTMNHLIADAPSFWHFINSWSELSNTGFNLSQPPPVLERWFFPGTASPILIPTATIGELSNAYLTPEERILSLPPLEERILHFSPENIEKLMENADLENNKDVEIWSLQAVIAHVWAGVIRARNLNWDQEVRFQMTMDNRATLIPPLSDEYFGNSVVSTSVTANVGELVAGGIGVAAKLLNQAVNFHTYETIRSDWENFVRQPSFISIDNFVGDVWITETTPRFNIYENNFGWGRPVAMRSGRANKYDGEMCVYPGSVEGSVEIGICLSPETMRALDGDDEFLKFVSAVDT